MPSSTSSSFNDENSLLDDLSYEGDAGRDSHIKLSEKYRASGRLDDALKVALYASSLWPECDRVRRALGFLYYDRNEPDKAIKELRAVIEREPYHVTAHAGLGMSLLAVGDWKEGWPEFGWRWYMSDCAGIIGQVPKWDRQNALNKTLLLICEGFGDTIHFSRYLPQVRALCKRLVVICKEEVRAFIARNFEVEIVSNWRELPAFDVYSTLVDTVGVLYPDAPPRINPAPYLKSDKQLASVWSKRLFGRSKGYRVGLVWRGNPEHFNDFRRSVDFELLVPLIMKTPSAAWLGLQKDAGPRELPIINAGPQLESFEDTAAVIENLDLVISIDSAVAHLAGAMGKPVWTLLPYAAEWRWPRKGDDAYWYPSMRLFRQSHPGYWPDVIDHIQSELSLTLSQRKEKMMLAAANV